MQWFTPVPAFSHVGHAVSVTHAPVEPARSVQFASAVQTPTGLAAPAPARPSAPFRQNFCALPVRYTYEASGNVMFELPRVLSGTEPLAFARITLRTHVETLAAGT